MGPLPNIYIAQTIIKKCRVKKPQKLNSWFNEFNLIFIIWIDQTEARKHPTSLPSIGNLYVLARGVCFSPPQRKSCSRLASIVLYCAVCCIPDIATRLGLLQPTAHPLDLKGIEKLYIFLNEHQTVKEHSCITLCVFNNNQDYEHKNLRASEKTPAKYHLKHTIPGFAYKIGIKNH